MRFLHRAIFVVTVPLLGAVASRGFAQSQADVEGQLAGVEVVERLGNAVRRDIAFTDETGRTASLADLSPGGTRRPLLLSFNYTNCPMLCSLQLAGVAKGLKELAGRQVPDFDIVVVSLNPTDSLSQLERSKQVYVGQAGGSPELASRWHYLLGSESAVASTADSVGVHYRYDPATKEYRHKASLVFITPDGRVSSYIHGITYSADALELGIRRAAKGEIFSVPEQRSIAGFLLDCFRYDPKRPTSLGLRVMRISGVFLLVALAIFAVAFFPRRRAKVKC